MYFYNEWVYRSLAGRITFQSISCYSTPLSIEHDSIRASLRFPGNQKKRARSMIHENARQKRSYTDQIPRNLVDINCLSYVQFSHVYISPSQPPTHYPQTDEDSRRRQPLRSQEPLDDMIRRRGVIMHIDPMRRVRLDIRFERLGGRECRFDFRGDGGERWVPCCEAVAAAVYGVLFCGASGSVGCDL